MDLPKDISYIISQYLFKIDHVNIPSLYSKHSIELEKEKGDFTKNIDTCLKLNKPAHAFQIVKSWDVLFELALKMYSEEILIWILNNSYGEHELRLIKIHRSLLNKILIHLNIEILTYIYKKIRFDPTLLLERKDLKLLFNPKDNLLAGPVFIVCNTQRKEFVDHLKSKALDKYDPELLNLTLKYFPNNRTKLDILTANEDPIYLRKVLEIYIKKYNDGEKSKLIEILKDLKSNRSLGFVNAIDDIMEYLSFRNELLNVLITNIESIYLLTNFGDRRILVIHYPK